MRLYKSTYQSFFFWGRHAIILYLGAEPEKTSIFKTAVT